MSVLPHLMRDIRQILFRDSDQHAIPAMDGALAPNDRLDACRPVGAPVAEADDAVEGRDGVLYVSGGREVLRLEGEGFGRRSVFASFEGKAGGLGLHPDGRLLVCVAGRGLAAVDDAGRQSWLTEAGGVPLRGLTSVAAAPDGTLFLSEGSTRHAPQDWCCDLMEKNRLGRVIACGPGFEAPHVLLERLAYPHGLALSADGKQLWWTESWSHRVSRAAIDGGGVGRPETVIRNLPGYPARLGKAMRGGFWLSIFARRTHLIELVLREDEFRREMMRTIEPHLWIAPSLAATGHYLEPMQMGNVKALGIQKPWAPPRSYGLVALIDAEGDAVESLHSRVGGRYHGITGAGETKQGLVVVSKGHGRVLLAGGTA
jgi:sugar lactone lactonase YvrE